MSEILLPRSWISHPFWALICAFQVGRLFPRGFIRSYGVLE